LAKCGEILRNRYFYFILFFRKSGVFLNRLSDDLGKVSARNPNKTLVATFDVLKAVSGNIVLVEKMPPSAYKQTS
jgi:hypothetical protein